MSRVLAMLGLIGAAMPTFGLSAYEVAAPKARDRFPIMRFVTADGVMHPAQLNEMSARRQRARQTHPRKRYR